MTISLGQVPNISELVHRNANLLPDHIALLVAGETKAGSDVSLTFRQLDEQARRIASWLRERYPVGTSILLLYPTSVHFAAAFVGCLYAGMVTVPAPPPGRFASQQRRVTAIARDAEALAVLTESAKLAEVSSWARSSGLDDLALLATDGDGVGEPAAWSDPGTGQDALALLQYTSGSTSDPKGVMVSHANLLHNVGSILEAFGASAPLRFGGWIPMFHDMGLIGILLPGLLLGGGSVLISPTAFLKRPYRWLQMISEYGVAVSAAPNFGYEQCTRHVTDAQISELDLSRWEFACNGSEPVRASTLRAFADRFAPAGFRATSYLPCYGLAEATLFVAGTTRRTPVVQRVDADLLEKHVFRPVQPGEPGRELVSMGAPGLGVKVRIVDPETREVLPQGRVGEIWLRGASVAQGYWRYPSATASTFRSATVGPDRGGEGGFLRTGDLGVFYSDELYVTGRIKDVLLVNGRNLYPHDIEQELGIQHEELRLLTGAVFPVSTAERGEADRNEIVIVHEIQGRDPDNLRTTARAIRSTVAREFGVHAAGIVLVRPNTVLRTTSGKVRRAAMRELFLSGGLEPVHENLDPAVAALRTGCSTGVRAM